MLNEVINPELKVIFEIWQHAAGAIFCRNSWYVFYNATYVQLRVSDTVRWLLFRGVSWKFTNKKRLRLRRKNENLSRETERYGWLNDL